MSLLSTAERDRYSAEAVNYLGVYKGPLTSGVPEIDVVAAQRWVAQRAYDIGWTKELFPNDSTRYLESSRERPYVERIGKKYQWIALDELLCRLADNCWIAGQYGEKAKVYNTPIDVGFERDIDPTIVPVSDGLNSDQGRRDSWLLGPRIVLDTVEERDLKGWPFKADPASSIISLTRIEEPRGSPWLTLYGYCSRTDRYLESGSRHGMRQQEFRFLMTVCLKQEDASKLAKYLRKRGQYLGTIGSPPNAQTAPTWVRRHGAIPGPRHSGLPPTGTLQRD